MAVMARAKARVLPLNLIFLPSFLPFRVGTGPTGLAAQTGGSSLTVDEPKPAGQVEARPYHGAG